jgi:hypothetical protein
MVKELIFENRAWEEAEHPRYVSEPLRISDTEERVFEISYHYVERKYFVETYETRIRANGIKETYGSWKFFPTLEECFNYIERTYNVKTVCKD